MASKKKTGAAAVGAAVRAQADKAMDALGVNVNEGVDHARSNAVKAARSVLAIHRKTIDGAFALLGKLDKQSEKLVKDALNKLPLGKDSKAAVNGWMKTLEKGRKDFQKTVDGGLDKLSKYVDGLEKKKPAAKKPAAKKKAAVKKKVVKRKVAVKKATAAGES